MEPLLAIIVAVAGAFGNEALNETARRTVGDLWEAAKKLIVTKYGSSQVPQLMDQMRREPTMSMAEHVAGQLTSLNATNDPEVARVFRELREAATRANSTTHSIHADTINGPGVSYGSVSYGSITINKST